MDEVSRSLAARIERLERQNRQQRWLLLGLPAVALLLGASAAQMADWKGKSVTTEKLLLVDTEGNPRASLVAGAGGASLVLRDGKGRMRVQLAADPEGEGKGPGVFLVGENGKVRAAMRAFEGKIGPFFMLANEDGTPLLSAGRSKDNGIGFVDFLDGAGKHKGGVGGSSLR